MAIAESQEDTTAAAKQSRKLRNNIAALDAEQELIAQRLELARPHIDALTDRLEDDDRQADQEHDKRELAAFNALLDKAEGKGAQFFLAALAAQWNKCPQSRYTPLIETRAFKSMMNPSPDEKSAAFEQLVDSPEREPTSPELVQARDIKRRMDDLNISAPQAAPVQRSAGVYVHPASAEQVHQREAPKRRLEAMNRLSNGEATDADRALLKMDEDTEHDEQAETA